MIIPLSQIKLDPNQPRKVVNERSVENLAKSLKVEGLIHPIEVDKDYMIVVGELRYRAARILGWKEIKANIYRGSLSPYERLRRQMAENLQQSGAKGGGQPMNAIDTAKAWVKLYELKTGKKYSPGEQFGGGRGNLGPFESIAEEVGVGKTNVWEYLQLLEQPHYVIEDIARGKPRTFYREADRLPQEYQEPVKLAIAEGKIKRRDDIIRLHRVITTKPEKIKIEMARLLRQQSTDANRILDRSLELQIVLKNATPEKWNSEDKKIVRGQLGATTGAIRVFVGKINKL